MKLMTIIKIVIIALLIGSLSATVVMTKMYLKSQRELKDTQIELHVKTTETTQLKDKEGKTFARVLEYEKTVKELKNSSDSIEKKLYAEARLNDIRGRQIEKLQYALIVTQDSLKSKINDTMVIIQGVNYDKCAKFNGKFLKADIYIQSDSSEAELTYEYTSEIYMTESWSKPKFFLWRWFGFKGKNHQFDFKVADSNAKVTVLRSISVNK